MSIFSRPAPEPICSPLLLGAPPVLRWFALYTMPHREVRIRSLLDTGQIESFLPTFDVEKVWKNRRRVKTQRLLFPSYLFIRIGRHQRSIVLSCPGAVRILGSIHTPLPIPDPEIEFLKSQSCNRKLEPCLDMVIGKRVRIRSGAMKGLVGTLVENGGSFRFVLTVAAIHQHAAIEIEPDEVEFLPN